MLKVLECVLCLGLVTLCWAWLLLWPETLPLPLPAGLAWPLPGYLVVGLGCYGLATVGWGLATFNECRGAAEELGRELGEARRGLHHREFRFSRTR
ncbi:dolichol-phosphate mannosyltransferase subunit 3 [Leucoraja erinacea]|uniref:dolichol-phosphate mannosyltransferase subunit 3 n=1 Tax=Leucoraja erinaceus TaxID=7782 RepID=UPI002455F7EC|nr:dolichol-phosphate mannosyltransferase subunit 3 [Leucoraja erinacea]